MLIRSLLLALVLTATASAQDMTAVVLPWDDASPGVADLSSWSHRPAGKFGTVRIGGDGHFYAGDERIRFWGVNLGPETIFTMIEDDADRDRFAARLSKFGFNAVRFHHMGANWTERNIFGPRPNVKTTETDAESFARFAKWVEACRKHGMYTNLNLLVSRQFRAADGLPGEIDAVTWKDQHVVGFWDDRMIALQKAYARQMLTTPMPSGGTLAADPALAIVEINNENGVIHSWLGGAFERLPAALTEPLRAEWNTWLAERYKDDATLGASWGVRDEALGDELLGNSGFSEGEAGWYLERHENAEAAMQIASAPDGQRWASIRVDTPGSAGWHVQLNAPRFAVKKGQLYTLSYRGRADQPRTIHANVRQTASPWGNLGLAAMPRLTAEWHGFTHTFVANADDAAAQVTFGNLSQAGASFEIADASLKPGGKVGVPKGATLASKDLPLPTPSEQWGGNTRARHDFIAFLHKVERDYWLGMRDFLKKDLGVKAAVVGTIAQCSPVTIQAELDAVDTHAYWQHPQFPAGDWDPVNWTVGNRTVVDEANGGPLAGLAMYAVAGKPHLVTEYDHPAPNPYGGEAALFAGAYGALQDWDGVFFFIYGGERATWDRGYVDGFFDWMAHPAKMANAVHGAALFRRGDVSPATEVVSVPFNSTGEIELLAERGAAWSMASMSGLGAPRETALRHRARIDIASDLAKVSVDRGATAPPHASDTGELVWRVEEGRGLFTINAPRSRGLVGWLPVGEQVGADGMGLRLLASEPAWCTAMVTLIEGESFAAPKRALVTVTGVTENTAMVWKNAERTSVGRDWGSKPSLVKVPALELTVPGRATLYALDERGQRGGAIAGDTVGDGTRVRIGSNGDAIRYELAWE